MPLCPVSGTDTKGDAKDSDMAWNLVLQGGATVPLRKRVHGTVAVASGEAICLWLVPEEVTNLLSEVRLRIQGKEVAVIRVR